MRLNRLSLIVGLFALASCVSAPVWKYDGRIYDTAEHGEAAAKSETRVRVHFLKKSTLSPVLQIASVRPTRRVW